jgi:AbrB family looped-hinge helix DNA binding protein
MANISIHVTSGGRIVIPKEIRRTLGIRDGDEVLIRLDEAMGEVCIATRRERLKRAQALVRSHVAKGRSLADELIRERRAEAENE